MSNLPHLAMFGAALLGAALALPAPARAFELSGAWTTEGDLCNRLFVKKGNGLAFAELSDLFGSGFIVEGNKIKGKAARCTITSRKQEGDALELAAACATSIVVHNERFELKVVDDDHFTRLFSDIPGMTLRYTRCTF
jgi:hypothetical protein